MEQSEVITVKIPKKLKTQMKQININWSEYLRQCLQKRIDEEKMRAAFKRLDDIKKTTKPIATEEIVAWIREDRER